MPVPLRSRRSAVSVVYRPLTPGEVRSFMASFGTMTLMGAHFSKPARTMESGPGARSKRRTVRPWVCPEEIVVGLRWRPCCAKAGFTALLPKLVYAASVPTTIQYIGPRGLRLLLPPLFLTRGLILILD